MALPFRVLTLDKPYQVRLDMAASIRYEQETGKSLIKTADRLMAGDFLIVDLAEIIMAMLRPQIPDLTIEKMTQMIDENCEDMTEITATVICAVFDAYETGEGGPNAKALMTLAAQKKKKKAR